MKNNKLCLGTVQFGMKYGINNQYGKPKRQDTFKMMDIARDKGIDVFDTAAAYGDAEEILGEYIKKMKLQSSIRVISKLRPNLIGDDCKNPQMIVENELIGSIKRLNIERLDGYLLHTPANFYNNGIMEGLSNCKKSGLVKNIGVSIYEMEHALDVVKSGTVDYIQIPYSIFDQRVDKTDFFNIARANKVTVYARSAFLQGLIFMNEENIPDFLEDARKHLKTYDGILKKYNLTRLEAAILFSYNNENVDYCVLGVDTAEQLIQDIDIVNRPIDYGECVSEIKAAFANMEKSVIFPSLWAKK